MKIRIKQFIKRILGLLSPASRAHATLIKSPDSYLYLTGWMRSLEEKKPVDRHGNPLPWMNYAVINLLKERLSKELKLFEYGSGYSTQFYATKVQSVISVEYNEKWLKTMKAEVPDNVSLLFIEKDIDGQYCRAIQQTDAKYDVVIVDGRDRVNCMMQSLPLLSEQGVVLLDDSHRERYSEGIEFLKNKQFKALRLDGLKPSGRRGSSSTIFYRDSNCLGL